MRSLIQFGLVGLLASSVAHAAEPTNIARMTLGYTYFNRPGADQAAHDADLADCMTLAQDLQSLDKQIGNDKGIAGALITGGAQKGVASAGTENCMVVRGWRVVRLQHSEGSALARLSLADLTARIIPWIGAENPHGEIVRIWSNDAARASTTRYAIRPAHTEEQRLSVRIRLTEPTAVPLPTAAPAVAAVKLDPKWNTKPLKLEELQTVPPYAMTVVIRIKGISMRNGTGLGFARIGPDKTRMPSQDDQAPDYFNPAAGTLFAKKEGNWIQASLPPGRWRLSAMGGMPAVDFCLGGPSFEGRAGEVIYLGDYDLASEDFGPDLSLDPVKAYLAGQPAAAQSIRPAVFTNGATGKCIFSIIYAIEMKDRPFDPTYRWGSAAVSAPATPSPAR